MSTANLQRTDVRVSRSLNTAFTFSEVLAMIVIIATLASLLFPVIVQAKEASKTAVCVSLTKQVGLAWNMYAVDHNDTMSPTGWVDGDQCSPEIPVSGVMWFSGFGARYGTTDEAIRNGSLYPYMNSDTLPRSCPAATEINRVGKGLLPSYSILESLTDYNIEVIGDDLKCSLIVTQYSDVDLHSETILISDGALHKRIDDVIQIEGSGILSAFGAYPPLSLAHARHAGSVATVGWLDGHLSSEKLSFHTRDSKDRFYGGKYDISAKEMKDHKLGLITKYPIEYTNPSNENDLTVSDKTSYWYLKRKPSIQ